MDDLHKQLDILQLKHKETEEYLKKLYWEIDSLEHKIIEEEQKDIKGMIPKYTHKLERLKVYMDEFMKEEWCSKVLCKFKKVDTYTNDFHQPMHDPLEWTLAEYDLLGMDTYLEIIFYYSKEAVKQFIENWIESNMKYVEINSIHTFFRLKDE